MKLRVDLKINSRQEWIDAVMADFDSFLQDHANCERKASAMAMSFVAKFPDRLEIIPELIDTAIEELDHFKAVYEIMQARGIKLPKEMGPDPYVNKLIEQCRSGREDRFMDRLLLASLVETRGAERFRLVYENLDDMALKEFYHNLWASEAKHGETFIRMALNYFDESDVGRRMDELNVMESDVIDSLPIKAALH